MRLVERPRADLAIQPPQNGGRLDSTPELNPMPQTGKGGMSMKNRPIQLFRQLRRVSIAMGNTLARFYRLCYRIRFSGIGVSLIPGLLTCNISFRAGGSGRARQSYPFIQHIITATNFALVAVRAFSFRFTRNLLLLYLASDEPGAFNLPITTGGLNPWPKFLTSTATKAVILTFLVCRFTP